jgi:tryptophan-rich sensory protein
MTAFSQGARSLAVVVLAVVAVAAFGAAFKPGDWYVALAKPAWTPPNWLFAPVWTILYGMVAIAGWLAWRRPGASLLFTVWVVALLLNAAWSWLFFGRHSIAAALIDIAALWCAIVAFMVIAWRPVWPASLLFVPYLLWVSFAAILNLRLWQLNS